MFNENEADERAHLNDVIERLQQALARIEQKISGYAEKILETKRYVYQTQLDSAEKAANRIEIFDKAVLGEEAVKERERIKKLVLSPYFGRIDFLTEQEETFYIGVHGFADPLTSRQLIYDWRAPVASMFYDFEIGPAFYIAPLGRIAGELTLKRQYRIKQSRMEYMIESSLNIGDEILQKELSQNSDDKMKNIVATIQREQNLLIRNEDAKVLIIQGAAGSGKTSIALHRVAFLLYRHKGTLTSQNIMILSPNKVFGDYISNVLPELGEENIAEMSLADIAENVMGKQYQYQTFAEQVEDLLHNERADAVARIEFKSTNAFVSRLRSFLEYAEKAYFAPEDLDFGGFHVAKKELLSRYHSYKNLPVKKRLERLTEFIIARYETVIKKKADAKSVRLLRKALAKFFKFPDAMSLYRHFYRWLGREDMLCFRKNTMEFCDVFAFVYTKLCFEGTEGDYKGIRHLLIDEMQDYAPIQYAVLAKLFSCNMTILGDVYQKVNPFCSSTIKMIRPYFADCVCVELWKSYRSTIEITNFTQKILANEKLLPMERHGEAPTMTICPSDDEQLKTIQRFIEEFRQSQHRSLGIVCRSQTHANQYFATLSPLYDDIDLLDFYSSEFKDGLVVTSVHMAKGLEFDRVIIPDASDQYYKTPMDRNLLYIAGTRAMHKLDVTCVKRQTEFLE